MVQRAGAQTLHGSAPALRRQSLEFRAVKVVGICGGKGTREERAAQELGKVCG